MAGLVDVISDLLGESPPTKPAPAECAHASAIDAQNTAKNEPETTTHTQPCTDLAEAVNARLAALGSHQRSEVKFSQHGLCGFVFSPSAISYAFCTRHAVIERLAQKRLRVPTDADLQGIFMLGTAAHRMIQEDILGPLGVLYGFWYLDEDKDGEAVDAVEGFQPTPLHKYKEVRCLDKENYIGGHTDGLLFIDGEWLILDIKTINSFSFGALQEPKEAHVKQVQLYARCGFNISIDVKPKRGVIMYLCKNTSQRKYFYFDIDLHETESIVRQIADVKEAIDTKTLPRRNYLCKSAQHKQAKECGACDLCFAVDTGVEGFVSLVTLLGENNE